MKKTLLIALFTASAPLSAGQDIYGLGSATAPWLKIPVSARSLGMADAGVALASTVDEGTMNPAALASVKGHQIGLMHNAWLQGTAVEHVDYGVGLGEGMGLGITFSYLGFGAVEKYGYDISGNLIANGSVNPSAYVGGLIYGVSLSGMDLGGTLKFLGQSLATSSSSTMAADLGAKLKLFGGLCIGAAVKDVGGQLEGSPLASALKLGGAWTSAELAGKGNAVALALDANGPLAEFSATSLNVGGEVWFQGLAAVRAGYRIARAGAGGLSGLSAGLGLRWQAVEVNYAYSSFGELGAANQVSLLARFGQEAQESSAKEKPKPKAKAKAGKVKKPVEDEEPGFRLLDDGVRDLEPKKKPASK